MGMAQNLCGVHGVGNVKIRVKVKTSSTQSFILIYFKRLHTLLAYGIRCN